MHGLSQGFLVCVKPALTHHRPKAYQGVHAAVLACILRTQSPWRRGGAPGLRR